MLLLASPSRGLRLACRLFIFMPMKVLLARWNTVVPGPVTDGDGPRERVTNERYRGVLDENVDARVLREKVSVVSPVTDGGRHLPITAERC